LNVVTVLSRLQIRIAEIIHRLFYVSLLWKMINRTSKSILDVGCGKGSSIVRQMRAEIRGQYILGCDIFPSYVKECKRSGLYDECVLADARRLPFKPHSFELVFCLEVIEHVEKSEGEELLSSLENLSSKEVVLSTLVGFMYQNPYNGNPYHTHKSAWFPSEFKRQNYKVIGVAIPFFIRGRSGYSKVDKIIISLAQIISFLLQPLFYFIPDIAFQMICVKEMRRQL